MHFRSHDRQLADRLSTEPALCQSDWLTVTSVTQRALRVDAIASKSRHSNDINNIVNIVCCQKYIVLQINTGASIHLISSQNTMHSIN